MKRQKDFRRSVSLWLACGLAGWLAPLKMKSPQLPEHAIVDASGKLKCFIEGAVEDTDYTEVSALLLPH